LQAVKTEKRRFSPAVAHSAGSGAWPPQPHPASSMQSLQSQDPPSSCASGFPQRSHAGLVSSGWAWSVMDVMGGGKPSRWRLPPPTPSRRGSEMADYWPDYYTGKRANTNG